ncbi:uncharacterized protein LAESUDRAFT_464936 [Laetiporus sulphureus 93-53]|uniref:Uncharacterized protein n=1 Tax=Laetiporus sulphureus 93-53 TaxID=1314785 RepID=A0A165G713_9APHY|nr:uncharacterized protein LAESUDRAFT_464936 [Laetiporus sulphureus 93-53]KZT09916.1 hypothetical protein LAESUDRAFT_464936 [Laetiporus sulphureus 93-53]
MLSCRTMLRSYSLLPPTFRLKSSDYHYLLHSAYSFFVPCILSVLFISPTTCN